jgi:hypothetical protein
MILFFNFGWIHLIGITKGESIIKNSYKKPRILNGNSKVQELPLFHNIILSTYQVYEGSNQA